MKPEKNQILYRAVTYYFPDKVNGKIEIIFEEYVVESVTPCGFNIVPYNNIISSSLKPKWLSSETRFVSKTKAEAYENLKHRSRMYIKKCESALKYAHARNIMLERGSYSIDFNSDSVSVNVTTNC